MDNSALNKSHMSKRSRKDKSDLNKSKDKSKDRSIGPVGQDLAAPPSDRDENSQNSKMNQSRLSRRSKLSKKSRSQIEDEKDKTAEKSGDKSPAPDKDQPTTPKQNIGASNIWAKLGGLKA